MDNIVGYVYKYVDTIDGNVKYVGLVNPGNSLKARIDQHKKDSWYHDKYDIYYIKAYTKTDCEVLESHFIEFYKSYNYYNIAKGHWGESRYINATKVQWIKFYENNNEAVTLKKSISNQNEEISYLKNEYAKSEKQYANIKKEIIDINQKIQHCKKELKNKIKPLELEKVNHIDLSNINKSFTADQMLLFFKICGEYVDDVFFESKLYDVYGKEVITGKITYNKTTGTIYYNDTEWVSNINDMEESEISIIRITVTSHYGSFYPNKDIYDLFVGMLKKLKNFIKMKIDHYYFKKYWKNTITKESQEKKLDQQINLLDLNVL